MLPVLSIALRLLPLACLASGCAIDDTGFVKASYYESPTARVVDLDAWGFHLVTNDVDGGLTFGHSERTYCFAKPAPEGTAKEFDLTQLIDPAALTEVDPDKRPRLRDLGSPLAFVSEDTGVSLRANDHRFGVRLGWQSTSALRIPLDFEGVVVIKVDPATPGARRVYIKEIAP